MSRTKRGKKPAGYEYWSRRPGPRDPGPDSKRETNRRERREAKEGLIAEDESDDEERPSEHDEIMMLTGKMVADAIARRWRGHKLPWSDG